MLSRILQGYETICQRIAAQKKRIKKKKKKHLQRSRREVPGPECGWVWWVKAWGPHVQSCALLLGKCDPHPETLRAVLQETQTLFPIMPDFSLFPAMPTCLKAAGDCLIYGSATVAFRNFVLPDTSPVIYKRNL